jgi:predicted porin
VDVGGNVNAFYNHTKFTGTEASNTIGTGLLPSALGIGGKTRQNDLDIAFQFTFFTGSSAGATTSNGTLGANNLSSSTTATALNSNTLNIRQAYLTVGDASWGTVKFGRDLGIYGSDAILSDMTLLGTGGNYVSGGSSTLGRIGQGYIYADWWGQISYTSPTWNGFQVSAGVFEPVLNSFRNGNNAVNDMMWQGKATYDFAANDVTGRVWLGGTYQKQAGFDSKGFDLGAKAAYQGLELVGYYYDGDNLSSVNNHGATAWDKTVLLGALNGSLTDNVLGSAGGSLRTEDTHDSGGYVQATYKIPGVGTKLGASWGESISTHNSYLPGGSSEAKVETWIIGAYHPLTKSLNLVAEYADAKNTYTGDSQVKVKTTTLGAILFF